MFRKCRDFIKRVATLAKIQSARKASHHLTLRDKYFIYMDEYQVKQLVSKGTWVLVMILVKYRSNNYRLTVWEKVDWMVCHSNWKHIDQRKLPVIHHFSEPEL